jgi:hypothetical protein
MKACTRCGETKPLDAFPRNDRRSDGRHSWCLACQREHVASYRASNREAYARQNAVNAARHRAKTRLAENHPEEFDDLVRLEMKRAGVAYYDERAVS